MYAVHKANLADSLFARLFWLLPTRLMSLIAGGFANNEMPWLKRLLIRIFLAMYPSTDMRDAAESDPQAYASFNAFFTRKLKDNARPLAGDEQVVVSPVDGHLGQMGPISEGRILQTKGIAYDIDGLLGDDATLAKEFAGGSFMTLYLAPTNYHRVHLPLAGRLRETRYVPGRLFGVNPLCVRAIPRLFSRNERLVNLYDTAVGPMALIMVGAFFVGGMHTKNEGRICPPHTRRPRSSVVRNPSATARGEEMGHFSFGSSVILLFGANAVAFDRGLASGQAITLGHSIGTVVDRRR